MLIWFICTCHAIIHCKPTLCIAVDILSLIVLVTEATHVRLAVPRRCVFSAHARVELDVVCFVRGCVCAHMRTPLPRPIDRFAPILAGVLSGFR